MISIVIPTYNRKFLLEKCLTSLLNQDYSKSKYEIIVIDDCSNDGTKLFINNLKRKYKNVKYLRHSNNKGVAASRNTGIKNSKGELIAIIADDYILPDNYLSLVHKYFKNRNIKVMCSKIINFNTKNLISKVFQLHYEAGLYPLIYPLNKNSFFIKIPNKKFIKKTRLIPASGAAIFRRDIFKDVGLFDERLRTGEDTDFSFRLNKKDINIYYNSFIEVKHVQRSDLIDLMKQVFNYGKTYIEIKRRYPESTIILPNSLVNIIRGLTEIFYRPLVVCRYAKSFKEFILYYPLLLLLDLSRMVGVFYGQITHKPD